MNRGRRGDQSIGEVKRSPGATGLNAKAGCLSCLEPGNPEYTVPIAALDAGKSPAQTVPAAPPRKEPNSEIELMKNDHGQPEVIARAHESEHPGIGSGPHQFGHHIRIEQEAPHLAALEGNGISRSGSRRSGSSSSTPRGR